MPKCPHCGSTAQVKHKKTTFEEDGEAICVIRYYTCGCGNIFRTAQYYCADDEEYVYEYGDE